MEVKEVARCSVTRGTGDGWRDRRQELCGHSNDTGKILRDDRTDGSFGGMVGGGEKIEGDSNSTLSPPPV